MKLLTISTSLFLVLFVGTQAFSQCNWQNLGPSDTNTVSNQGTAYSDLALDGNDHSYLVFTDGAVSGKITVRKYNGTFWSTLGTSGFSAGQASYNSIAIDTNNIPYVAYCDQGNGNKVIVKKFDGTNWIQVGLPLSTNTSSYTSLAIDGNNMIYVAFRDGDNANKVTVKMFDGTNWVIVGNAGFSTGAAAYVSLAISSTNVPYVVYQDGGNSNKATVKKFDGSAWVSVGTEGFSLGSAAYTDIAVNSLGIPYVVYADGGNADKITTMSYDGTNWILMGPPSLKGTYSSITINENDVVHVIYNTYSNANVSVTRYNPVTNNWYFVGNYSFVQGWMHHSIAIASDGTVYIAFKSSAEISVWHCVNDRWEIVGVPGLSPGLSSATTALVVSRDGIPYVAYADYTNSGRIYVKKFANNSWEQVGGVAIYSNVGNEFFSLAMDTSDVPYIIAGTVGGFVSVKKFDGTDWVSLPPVNDGFNTAKGYYCDIVFDHNNTLYISFRDDNPSSTTYNKAEVRKFDGVQYWPNVNNITGNASLGTVRGTSLAVDSQNIPYIAYVDQSSGGKVSVRKHLPTGVPWTNVGPNYSITAGEAFFVNIAISNDDVPYIVYQDFLAGKKATVKKFNGTNWVTVGPVGFTPGQAYNTDIAIDALGTPYVSFGDKANGDKLSVMKFDGTNWVQVGTPGFSADHVVDLGGRPTTTIAIDPSGAVYTAYWHNGYTAAKKFNTSLSTHHHSICTADLPFQWNGDSYTNSGTYQHVLTNTAGCDSTVALFLTVNTPATGTDIQSACDSFTWIDGNTYVTDNNTATHTIPGGAANGCDSIVTLNLSIHHPTTGTDTQIACESFTWIDGNTYTQNNTTATHTLTNSHNCDSIVTLNLTILQGTSSVDTHTSCGSFTWNGTTYTSSNNTATRTFTGSNGCDSIVTLNLTILPVPHGTDYISSCGPVTWINGTTYYSSNYNAAFNIQGGAANGCDSVALLSLTITSINTTVTNTGTVLYSNHSSATSYEWFDCSTGASVHTGQTFHPAYNGSFKVKVTVGNCNATSTCYTINPLGLADIDPEQITVYPNPTKDLLNVSGVNVETIRVLSLSGQVILTASDQNNIDVSALSNGCYFIEINKNMLKMFTKE